MKKVSKHIKYYLGFAFCLTLFSVEAQHNEQLISLKGNWKFSINPSDKWVSEKFDDSEWGNVSVPSPWENQGYHGFNGFGYYRKSFYMPQGIGTTGKYLYLGFVDDADVVYINGVKIGSSGSFPPKFYTAYNAFRKYFIPGGILKEGAKNTIAVQVYDVGGGGGIVGGDIGIYGELNPMEVAVDMSGLWKFKPGDKDAYKMENYNDNSWEEIIVPSTWEEQGFNRLDGFAWYRRKVFIPANLRGKMIVVLLGKIDDVDQTFLNGQKVGQVGEFTEYNAKLWSSDDWVEPRAYFISPDKFKAGQTNTIAVRVYDPRGGGGIYKGPVAIIEKDKYVAYNRRKRKH